MEIFVDIEDSAIVDVNFAGDNFEFMYILTATNLYKLTGKCTKRWLTLWEGGSYILKDFAANQWGKEVG